MHRQPTIRKAPNCIRYSRLFSGPGTISFVELQHQLTKLSSETTSETVEKPLQFQARQGSLLVEKIHDLPKNVTSKNDYLLVHNPPVRQSPSRDKARPQKAVPFVERLFKKYHQRGLLQIRDCFLGNKKTI